MFLSIRRIFFCSRRFAHKLSYFHGESPITLRGITVGNLLEEQVERSPDQVATVLPEQNVRKTFAELLKDVDKLASGLGALGLSRGDRVGILGPNSYEWVLTQYATARLGLILVNINPAYRRDELKYCLQNVGVNTLVSARSFKTQRYVEMMLEICPELSGSGGRTKSKELGEFRNLIVMDEEGVREDDSCLSFSEVLNLGGREEYKMIDKCRKELQFDDPINIQFTSGTTGLPKGATLSHHNIVNNSYFVGYRCGYTAAGGGVICCPVPLYHCFGMVLACLQMITNGCTVVFPWRAFEAEKAISACEAEECNALYGTPTMFIDMLNITNIDKYNLSSLSTGIMAGSPCPVEVMRQVVEKLHMSEVTICYGTTENSPVTFQSDRTDSIERRVTSIGRPHPHVEVKVCDENGQIVGCGQTGELYTRGYTTMLGYWGSQQQTDEVIGADRWYRTGDLAVIDQQGYGFIVGRRKDMIIRGGENIYPLEVEQFLYEHPSVADVQVIGVADYRLGEEVCAWIKLKPGKTMTVDEVKTFCKGKLAHFKIPRYVRFVETFPMTVTGKVQKYLMRQEMAELLKKEKS